MTKKKANYLKRVRDREIDSPAWGWRRYLRAAGRRDGRKQIPKLDQPGWRTPLIEELTAETSHTLGLIGTDFFVITESLNAAVVAARRRRDDIQDSANEAVDRVDATEARTEGANGEEVVRLRRRARADLATSAAIKGRLGDAEAALAEAISRRQDAAAIVREHGWAFVHLVQAAEAIYWAANLRVRPRSVLKLAEHVCLAVPDPLPDWLVSDAVFDRVNEAVTRHATYPATT